MAAVPKTEVAKVTVGSNPTPSAKFRSECQRAAPMTKDRTELWWRLGTFIGVPLTVGLLVWQAHLFADSFAAKLAAVLVGMAR